MLTATLYDDVAADSVIDGDDGAPASTFGTKRPRL